MKLNKLLIVSCITSCFTAFAQESAPVAPSVPVTPIDPVLETQPVDPAPTNQQQSRKIPGRYIVVFKPEVNSRAETANITRSLNSGEVKHVYEGAIKGFTADLSPSAVNEVLVNPNVQLVEEDQTVQLNQVQIQSPAPWGLDRLDQPDRPLNSVYQFPRSGAGVTAFIIDTGIRTDHVDFAGRLQPGFSTITDGNGTNDCNGHGTHVAGTVGGSAYGVAKAVTLVPVRVLDCEGEGTWSSVIAGIDWVANSTARPAVANLSLGGGYSSAINAAVAGAVNKGVTVVVAAGNENVDACGSSPASEPSVITVGASTSIDSRASFSNYGACVDIFAPGSNITSAGHTASTAAVVMSGTSMAAPHVAGAAALILSGTPSASPEVVAGTLKVSGNTNKLSTLPLGSPNLLLSSLGTAIAPELANTISVRALTGSKGTYGATAWRAYATATVRNFVTGTPISGATVYVSFTTGTAVSCVTVAGGYCVARSAPLSRSTYPTVTGTVINVSKPGLTYDASKNTLSRIVITRP